jgi:DNA-binding transcriptional MerR regulator
VEQPSLISSNIEASSEECKRVNSKDMHQIGEVASQAGLSLRTIRYYEEVGLVVPSGRTQGGFRLYTDSDIDRLLLIKQMKPLDFTLDEMRDLLTLRADLANAFGRGAEELIERLVMYAAAAGERCKRLREQLDNVEQFSNQLRSEIRSHRRRMKSGAS